MLVDAQWIAVAEEAVAPAGYRPVYALRHEFTLNHNADAVLTMTALGQYETWINGERISDRELAPGFTDYRFRLQVQTYDVSSLLRAGSNVIVVYLGDGWYRGEHGMPRGANNFGDTVAVLGSLRIGNDVVLRTSTDWTVAASHITRADPMEGQHEDRRSFDSAIHLPGFTTRNPLSVKPWKYDGELIAEIAPPVRVVEVLPPHAFWTLASGDQVVDFGQNINGWIRLRALGPRGSVLSIQYAEQAIDGGDIDTSNLEVHLPIIPAPLPAHQRDEVVSAGTSGDVFEPRFTTKGFRYVRISGLTAPLSASDIDACVVQSDLERIGGFTCSDSELNRLHDAAVWSMRSNIVDVPMDCPSRERAAWTGDWQIYCPTAAYLYDVLDFTKKFLADIRLGQREDGAIPNNAPSDIAGGFAGKFAGLNASAGWGDVIVSTPLELYRAYGDVSVLRENWDAGLRWLEFALAHTDNELWSRGFHWGEWMEPGFEIHDFGAFMTADKSVTATAYLIRTCDQLAEIAALIDEDAAAFRRQAAASRAAWNAAFVANSRITTDRQADCVRALSFELVPDEVRASVAAQLADLVRADGVGTGFLATGMLLPALADSGYPELAFEVLQSHRYPGWLYMLDRGATTMWEQWDGVDDSGAPHGSLNHYSKGAVISFMHHHIAGLRAIEPGFERIEVQPTVGGGLSFASTWQTTRHGRIDVAWRIGEGRFTLVVTSPVAGFATLPDGSTREFAAGTHRWEQPWED